MPIGVKMEKGGCELTNVGGQVKETRFSPRVSRRETALHTLILVSETHFGL